MGGNAWSTGTQPGNPAIRHKSNDGGATLNTEEGSVRHGTMTWNLLPIPRELDTITGAFSLRNEKGENRMSTRKSKNVPQRTDGDTSQAGCRGFESRPPLLLFRTIGPNFPNT
jgi:hypothetical protein